MAIAALNLKKCTGTNAATETTISDKRLAFLSIDSTGNDYNANPIPVPRDAGSSPAYGMELWIRWELAAAPDGYLNNFKYAGPATQPDAAANPPNKVTIYAGTTGTGATPVKTQSSVATAVQHSSYYSEATALAIGVVPGDGKLEAVGEKTNFLVLQPRVAYLAVQGVPPTQVHVLYFDEV